MEEKHKLNSQERQVNRMITGVRRQDRRNWKKLSGEGFNYYTPAAVAVIAVIWFFGAHITNNFFIFPTLESVVYSVFDSLKNGVGNSGKRGICLFYGQGKMNRD